MALTKYRIPIVIARLFAACVLLRGSVLAEDQPALPPREEWQVWTDVIHTTPVSASVDWHLMGTLKLGRGFTRLVNERFGTGFTFRLNRFVSFSPYYGFSAFQPYAGRDVREHRAVIDTTLHWTFGGFSFSDRNRLERRFVDDFRDSTRYRNSFLVEHPVESGRANLRVFAYDEVFWESALHAWNRNRFAAGVKRRFSPMITVDVYYLRQNDGFARPGDIHAVCTTVRLRS